MGHYCVIKFSAQLNDIGVEILSHLKDHSLLETAKVFNHYPFVEVCFNRFQQIYFPLSEFSEEDKTWKVNWEHKIKNYEAALKFILPYMITSNMEFIYADEHGDWKERSIVLIPIDPKIDYDRNFGEAIGIEI